MVPTLFYFLLVAYSSLSLIEARECEPFVHIISSGFDRSSLPEIRAKEYEDAMIKNLQNPVVKAYHIFWETGIDHGSLSFLDEKLKRKIIHAKTNVGRIRYVDGFKYSNDNKELNDQVVAFINADIVLGKGFDCENLSNDKLPLNKMYIPIRKEDDSCPGWKNSEYKCDCRKWSYQNVLSNCFDTYIFRAPVPERLALEESTGFLMGGK